MVASILIKPLCSALTPYSQGSAFRHVNNKPIGIVNCVLCVDVGELWRNILILIHGLDEEMQEKSMLNSTQPLRALGMMVDKNVVVKLKAGRVLGGVLRFIDQCMNIVLDDAEELDARSGQVLVKYGRVLIRGNQVLYVSLRSELV